MNYWKISTFVFGGALALTVSTGAITSALAEPTRSRLRILRLRDAG